MSNPRDARDKLARDLRREGFTPKQAQKKAEQTLRRWEHRQNKK